MKKWMRYGIAPWVALALLILVVIFYDQFDRFNPFDGCLMSERPVVSGPGHVICEPR